MTIKVPKKKHILTIAIVLVVLAVFVLVGCKATEDAWYDDSTFLADITNYNILEESSATVSLFVGNDGTATLTTVWIEVDFYDANSRLIATKREDAIVYLDKGESQLVKAYFFDIYGIAKKAVLKDMYAEYGDYRLFGCS